jgi:hypothetical protein
MGLALLLLLALAISGFTVVRFSDAANQPNLPQTEPPAAGLTNVIKNGDFEDNPRSGIATHWEPYDNGGAHFGWYMEEWWQAVHSGERSQLMEIFRVESFKPNRVMAIYQTVEVSPNANYNLTIHALMRSDAPQEDRNQGEYAMDWGIDYSGEGKYYKVTQWVNMPVVEQLRLGGFGPQNDALPLFFERFTSTVHTGSSNKITLFIRAVKLQPTGTEVNYNVDDVSLIGPYPVAPPPQPEIVNGPPEVIPAAASEETATEDSTSPASDNNLPNAGAILPRNISGGALALGGLVLIVLGATAASSLLYSRKT